ncbi:MAG: hypothetical protein Q8P18_25420 [Pseudomonadota bacterium]|nr:hypothetical protein [Pseudomonadota bacterium]
MTNLLFAFLACESEDVAVDDSGHDTAPAFVETLDPDQLHILAASSPALGDPGHPLAELSLDLEVRWSVDFDNGDGTAGAVRFDNGETVYVRTALPPNFFSSLERVAADGTLLWTQHAFFSDNLSFAHGLVRTPDGDYLIADTILSRVLSVSEEGVVQWELSFRDEGGARLPNGIDLQTDSSGVTRIVVSQLVPGSAARSDQIEVYRLGGRTELPTLEWSFVGGSGPTERLWPHGPRFMEDGTVMVSYAARGQIGHLVEGVEEWRVPEVPGVLAFPRDTVVLPDGSWLVADAAEEVLRVHDPLGRFEIVGAAYVPGVFGLTSVTCGEGGGLPCLD